MKHQKFVDPAESGEEDDGCAMEEPVLRSGNRVKSGERDDGQAKEQKNSPF